MRTLVLAFGVFYLLHTGESCAPTPAPDTPAPTSGPTDPPEPDSCAGELGLQGVGTTGYGDGGPVEDAPALDWDSGNPSGGCWKNHESPADQLQFGKMDDGSALSNCGTGNGPSGPAIVHYSPDGSGGDVALWHSCSVLCSKQAPTVTVSGSKSDGVTLEACLADSFAQPVLRDCTPVQFGQPVQIGNAERPSIYDIVLKASNFQKDDFAAITKIQADFEKCPDKAAVNCDGACEFANGDTCGYTKDSSSKGETEFKAYQQATIVGNLDSGVNAKLDGNPNAQYPDVADSGFLATPQNPGDVVVISKEVNIQQEQDMHFEYYDACDGNSAKICFNSVDANNCKFASDLGITKADRGWRKGKVPVPNPTTKIFLVGENSGSRFCATGFSHLTFSESGKDTPACNNNNN